MSYVSQVLADFPVGFWLLNEVTGTTAADSSGAGRDGTYSGSFTLGAQGPTSQINASLSVAGAGKVTLPGDAAFDLTFAWTVEGWAKFSSLASQQDVLAEAYEGGSNAVLYQLGVSPGGVVANQVGVGFYDGTWHTVNHAADTNWHYLVGTWDGTTLTFQIDDQPDVTTTTTNSGTTYTSPTIGSRNDGIGWVTGSLAAVAIYPTALSRARRLAHYKAALSMRLTGLDLRPFPTPAPPDPVPYANPVPQTLYEVPPNPTEIPLPAQPWVVPSTSHSPYRGES